MQNRSLVVVLAASCLSCTLALAGEPFDIVPGDKLRIRLAEGRVLGTLEALDDRTLTIKGPAGAITSYPLATLRGVEVSRGRHSRLGNAARSALTYGAIGAAVGVGVMAAASAGSDEGGGAWLAVGAAEFGGFGIVLGALGGALTRPGEAWHAARLKGLHASLAPMRGGAQFRVTLAF